MYYYRIFQDLLKRRHLLFSQKPETCHKTSNVPSIALCRCTWSRLILCDISLTCLSISVKPYLFSMMELFSESSRATHTTRWKFLHGFYIRQRLDLGIHNLEDPHFDCVRKICNNDNWRNNNYNKPDTNYVGCYDFLSIQLTVLTHQAVLVSNLVVIQEQFIYICFL